MAARIVSVLGVKEYTFSTVNRRHVAARIVSVLRVKEYKDMSRKHVAARIVSVPRVHSEKQMCRRQCCFCSTVRVKEYTSSTVVLLVRFLFCRTRCEFF